MAPQKPRLAVRYQIVSTCDARIWRSRLSNGTPSARAVAAIMRSGMSGTSSRLTCPRASRNEAHRILNVIDGRDYDSLVIVAEASLFDEVLDLHDRDSGKEYRQPLLRCPESQWRRARSARHPSNTRGSCGCRRGPRPSDVFAWEVLPHLAPGVVNILSRNRNPSASQGYPLCFGTIFSGQPRRAGA